MNNNLEQNKQTVRAFYDLMFNQFKPREAIEQYAGDNYIQHNPEVADGKETFFEYFERMAAEYPGKKAHFKRAIADGKLESAKKLLDSGIPPKDVAQNLGVSVRRFIDGCLHRVVKWKDKRSLFFSVTIGTTVWTSWVSSSRVGALTQ